MSKLDQFESAEITTEDLENVAGGYGFWGPSVSFKSNIAVSNAQNFTATVGILNYVTAVNSVHITQS